jgi:hypothetical protein
MSGTSSTWFIPDGSNLPSKSLFNKYICPVLPATMALLIGKALDVLLAVGLIRGKKIQDFQVRIKFDDTIGKVGVGANRDRHEGFERARQLTTKTFPALSAEGP